MKWCIILHFTVLGAVWAEENITNEESALKKVVDKMTSLYASSLVKEYNSNSDAATLTLEDVQVKIAESNDPCEQSYYWDGWQTKSGRAVRAHYEQYVQLKNRIAVYYNFSDNAASWQSTFKTDNFPAVAEQLMEDVTPLFKQVHAHLRRQLWILHCKDNDVIDPEGPIPASLLGNIWGMDAIGVFDETVPFPDEPSLDVTSALQSQGYTGLKMAKASEEFFVSLGFDRFNENVWKNSTFERPAGSVDYDCTDFSIYNNGDSYVKMCTEPIEDDWGRVHYQMAFILTYMQWKGLSTDQLGYPSQAFRTLIGDTIYLFATCPVHLQHVGLLDSSIEIDKEKLVINALYQQALSIFFRLPYGYSLDLWRWGVFQGKITPDNYNCEYWKIREAIQGVEPPVDRDERDFDPGAKSHVINDYQYMPYFMSGILQFQVHKGLCEAAGKYDPSKPAILCDIYNSTEAGDRLKSFMSLGSTKTWQDTLEKLTGTRNFDAGPLLAYFRPLYEWLQAENSKNNEKIGWTSKHKRCYPKGETKPTCGKCRYS